MKKYLLTAAGLALSVGLSAQFQVAEPMIDKTANDKKEEAKSNYFSNSFTRGGGGTTPSIQSLGDTIFTETFSDGLNGDPGNGSWNNVGNADWEYRGPNTTPDNTVGSRGAFAGPNVSGNEGAPINSESQNVGFMIFDSDYLDNNGNRNQMGQGSNPTPHQGELESPTIDLSGYNAAYLNFTSFFRRFLTTCHVVISTDGGASWPDTIRIYENDFTVNAATQNAEDIFFPLPSGATNTNIKIKFVFDGETESNPNGSGYYYWQIDDIRIIEAPDHDLAIDQVHIGNIPPVAPGLEAHRYYSRVPAYQLEEVDFTFGAWIDNLGLLPQSGSKAELYIDHNKITETTSKTIGVNGSDTVGMTGTTSISNSPGDYLMSFVAASDNPPGFPDNDSINQDFYVTDSTYSWVAANDVGRSVTFGSVSEFMIATNIDVVRDDTASSIEIYVSSDNDSTNNPVLRFFIWDDALSSVIQTQNITIDQNMHDQWNTIKLPAPIHLSPGRYFVGFDVNSGPFYWNEHSVIGKGFTLRDIKDGNGWGILNWASIGFAPAPAIGLNLKGAGCPELTAQTSVLQEAGCGESDGVAVVTPNESNVTVRWPDGTEGDTNSTLSATTHTVEIIQGVCRTTVDVVVSNTNAPVANQANDGLEITSGITANFVNAQEAGDLTLAQDAELKADFSGGTQPYQYVWDPSGDTTTNASISNLGAGSQYRVTIVDDNDCLGISRRVTITQPPVMKVFITKEHSEDHAETTLRAHVIGGTAPYDYTWNNNESGETITVDEEIADQSYSVTVRDHGGNGGQAGECGGETYATEADADQVTIGDDEIYVDGCEYITSIEEINISEGIKVYPNPNNGQFNVEFNDLNGTYTVTMRNLVGQIVGQERINVSGVNVSTMDYTNVANGVYILEVTSDKGERATYKVNKK